MVMEAELRSVLEEQRLSAVVPLLERLGVESRADLKEVADTDLASANLTDIQRRKFSKLRSEVTSLSIETDFKAQASPERATTNSQVSTMDSTGTPSIKSSSVSKGMANGTRGYDGEASAPRMLMQDHLASQRTANWAGQTMDSLAWGPAPSGSLPQPVADLQGLVAEVSSVLQSLEEQAAMQKALGPGSLGSRCPKWHNEARRLVDEASQKLYEVRDLARSYNIGTGPGASLESRTELAALRAYMAVFSNSLVRSLETKLENFQGRIATQEAEDSTVAKLQKQLSTVTQQVHSLRSENKSLQSVLGTKKSKAVVLAHCNEYVSNHTPIKHPEPVAATLVENTMIFLPLSAVRALDLEPNLDDKGDDSKELWFGRVWELKALLHEHKKHKRKRRGLDKEKELSEEDKLELDRRRQAALKTNPKLFDRLCAYWKGAAQRARDNLKVLEKLKWSALRGTLVYAHGSGGNSWDNFRICRMVAKLGVLVIAPDGFAYPKETAMGSIRHKDLQPLKKSSDNVDYWEGDLIYASAAEGAFTYSTSSDAVLNDPDHWREFYENCYRLRRDELHYIIKRLPGWVKTQGFFLGGTSEGAMTVARFDDERYGTQVLGRFINSFSIEYCYFTPTPEAGVLGGNRNVPTLNIIGTKDQYFGAEDSIAKIVSEDVHGYGKQVTGNGYATMVQQGVTCGLVCVLENGVHSPCDTHDNFLRELFHTFFTRPASIPILHHIWEVDPYLKTLVKLEQSEEVTTGGQVTRLLVPTMPYPNKMSNQEMYKLFRKAGEGDKEAEALLKKLRDTEAADVAKTHEDIKANLDSIRSQSKGTGGKCFKNVVAQPRGEKYDLAVCY
eukprot:TRINITY_DN103467_c0_g1_i1.p1 TRINITY_DN103467_c0_g1~~TRINITY_DN103467_c0_g1_i1.p1  ORF type:complete len:842 (-),score=183.78 TRINITY_DN103467_c0_g1_i1:52-2577(-)